MRRTLLVTLAVLLVPLAGAAGAQTAAPTVPPGTYQRVVAITFPVSGEVRYGNDYHANRGGGTRVHQATDIMGRKLQPLHAAVDGEICYVNGITEPMPTWGYSITLCGDDGLEYRYVHINNDNPGSDDGLGGPEWAYAPRIREGVRVARGQWIAYMGDSGNAEDTVTHLHFEIADPDLVDPELAKDRYKQGRINPYPSLEDARDRGDVPAAPDLAVGVRRLAGSDRIGTAVALSAQRDSARTVIVVPAASHAEALVAAPLAGLLDAPVLLSGPQGLDEAVADEVGRLGARNAYLIGRPDQLSDQVEADLTAAGVAAQARLTAEDPLSLSAVVAAELASYPSAETDRVFLALGDSPVPSRAWPDALSASALAADQRAPILLTRTDELPEAVGEVLAELGPGRVTVVGGPVAISDAVAESAAARAAETVTVRAAETATVQAAETATVQAAETATARVERLSGDDRYGTSVAVAAEARRVGMTGRTAWLATGLNFPDALAAGPAAARTGAPLLLVDGLTPGASPDTENWLSEGASRLEGAIIVGGTAAVSDPVREEIARLVGR